MANFKSNTIAADTVLIKLGDIETARINWETGSYKKSNEELYAVLDRCLVLYQDIKGMTKGKRKVIKEIDMILSSRGGTVQKNTSLVTKIVRYVFGDCGKRAFTYATVINVTDLEKPEAQSFHSFITGRGGIEEIRKQGKDGELSSKEKRDLLINAAEDRLAEAEPLLSGIKLIDDLQPDNENGMEMMAVLMRKDDDGTGSIVYRSNSETIISSLLAAAEREKIAKAKEAAKAQAPANEAKARSKAIKEAAAA